MTKKTQEVGVGLMSRAPYGWRLTHVKIYGVLHEHMGKASPWKIIGHPGGFSEWSQI